MVPLPSGFTLISVALLMHSGERGATPTIEQQDTKSAHGTSRVRGAGSSIIPILMRCTKEGAGPDGAGHRRIGRHRARVRAGAGRARLRPDAGGAARRPARGRSPATSGSVMASKPRLSPPTSRRPDAAARLAAELERRGLAVDVLVNNAGYGVPGRYEQSTWARHDAYLQVMVTAVCELTLPPAAWDDRAEVGTHHQRRVAGRPPAGARRPHAVRGDQGVPGALLRIAARRARARRRPHLRRLPRVHLQRVPRRDRHARQGEPDAAALWMDAPTVAEQGYAAVMRGAPVYIPGRVNRSIAWLARVHASGPGARAVAGSGKSSGRRVEGPGIAGSADPQIREPVDA